MTLKIQTILVITIMLCPFVVQGKNAAEVFEKVSPSIVVITTYNSLEKGMTLGSGVIIDDGVIVTNCHVVEKATTIQVKHRDKTYPAKILHSDWDRDVCSLSVGAILGCKVIKGSTRHLKVGDKVYAVGAPKGLELTLSDGIISSLRPVIGGQYLQTTAPISPGSSGGGLFDEEGQLIGLPTFYIDEGQQLNFAVPVEWVAELPSRKTTAPASGKTTTIEKFSKAVELEKRKDWPALLEFTHNWITDQSEDVYAWTFLCIAYGETKQHDKAIESCQHALRITPEHADAWFNLGSAYRESNQPDKAIEAYRQAIRIYPEHADAWGNLAIAYDRSNQLDKTIEAYKQTLLITPQDDRVWYNLGIAYKESNQLEEAIGAFQQALRISPEKADAWTFLGIVNLESNRFDKAIVAFKQAIRITPKDTGAWINLGIAYKKSDQSDQVMDVYKRLKDLDPELADKFFNQFVLP